MSSLRACSTRGGLRKIVVCFGTSSACEIKGAAEESFGVEVVASRIESFGFMVFTNLTNVKVMSIAVVR